MPIVLELEKQSTDWLVREFIIEATNNCESYKLLPTRDTYPFEPPVNFCESMWIHVASSEVWERPPPWFNQVQHIIFILLYPFWELELGPLYESILSLSLELRAWLGKSGSELDNSILAR